MSHYTDCPHYHGTVPEPCNCFDRPAPAAPEETPGDDLTPEEEEAAIDDLFDRSDWPPHKTPGDRELEEAIHVMQNCMVPMGFGHSLNIILAAARRCDEAERERDKLERLYVDTLGRAVDAAARVAELEAALRGFMEGASQRVVPEDIGGPPEPPFIICNFCGESVGADLGVGIDHDPDCPIPAASRALSEPTGGTP